MGDEEHKKLSNFIKSVHNDLRNFSKLYGAQKAWNLHCSDEAKLQNYSQAMKTLAIKYWKRNNQQLSSLCRISWVVEQCEYYFYKNGSNSELLSELKLANYYFFEDKQLINNLIEQTNEFHEIKLNEKLKLLDVGSCYNPFTEFECFDVTAIDIAPATPDVVKCDFLQIETEHNSVYKANYYDVIVFSLLLEYLPESSQRYKCCEIAYNLLRPNGLLFIITPDSNHVTSNSKMINCWRRSLASLGFLKFRYEKLKHIHCLAYRKCLMKNIAQRWYNNIMMKKPISLSPCKMFQIPQDSKKLQELVHMENKKTNKVIFYVDPHVFDNLPNFECME